MADTVYLRLLPLICSARDHLQEEHLNSLFFKLNQRKTPFFVKYLDYFWNVAVYIVGGSSQISLLKRKKYVLLLLWVVAIYLLEALFTGDLITAMATQNNDLFIDSWDDLLARSDVERIAITNYKNTLGFFPDFIKSVYFAPGKYKALTDRLKVYNVEVLLQPDLFFKILPEVSEGKMAVMYHKTVLELYVLRYADLHLSRMGDFIEPYFVISYTYTPQQTKETLNHW